MIQDTNSQLKNQKEAHSLPQSFKQLAHRNLKELLENFSLHIINEEEEPLLNKDIPELQLQFKLLFDGVQPALLFTEERLVKVYFEEFIPAIVKSVMSGRRIKNKELLSQLEQILEQIMDMLFRFDMEAYPKSFDSLKYILDIYRSKFYSLNRQAQLYKINPLATEEFLSGLKVGQDLDVLKIQESEQRGIWCQGSIVSLDEHYICVALSHEELHQYVKLIRDQFNRRLSPLNSLSCQQQWRQTIKQGEQVDWLSFNHNPRYWQCIKVNNVKVSKNSKGENVILVGIDDSQQHQYINVYTSRIQKPRSCSEQDWFRDDSLDIGLGEEVVAVVRPDHLSSFLVKFVNRMGQKGYFNKIIQIVKKDQLFQIAPSVIQAITNAEPIFTRKFLKKYMPELKSVLLKNLTNAGDQAIRSLTKQKIQSLVLGIFNFQRTTLPYLQRIFNYNYNLLQINYICMTSNYLQRKLQGIGSITDIFKSARIAVYYYQRTSSKEEKKIDWSQPLTLKVINQLNLIYKNTISLDFMIQWMKKNQIFQKLYNPNNHVQVIQKAIQLVYYITIENCLSDDDLLIMWNCSRRSDNQSRQAIYKSIEEFCRCLQTRQKRLIYEKILDLPLNEVGTAEICLLNDLSVYSSDLSTVVKYMWKVLTHEHSAKDIGLAKQISKKISSNLKTHYMNDHLLEHFEHFLKDYGKPGVLKYILQILDGVLYTYQSSFTLDLKNYLHQTEFIVRLIQGLNKDSPDLESQVDFVIFFLNLLTNQEKGSSMLQQYLQKTWSKVVPLRIAKFYARIKTVFLGLQHARMVAFFQKQMCSLQFLQNANQSAFSLFKDTFLAINTALHKINKSSSRIKAYENYQHSQLTTFSVAVDPLKLHGYESFLSLLFQNLDLEVIREALQFNDSLFEHLEHHLKGDVQSLKAQFLQKWQEKLYTLAESPEQNQAKLSKYLQIFRTIINQSQVRGNGGLFSLERLKKSCQIEFEVINEFNTDSALKKFKVKIRSNATLLQARQFIGIFINSLPNQYVIFSAEKEIPDYYNGQIIANLPFKLDKLTIYRNPASKLAKVRLINEDDQVNPLARRVFQELFNTFSTNGLMSRQEAYRFLRRCTGEVSYMSDDQRVERMFQDYDKDKDGYLRIDQFCTFYEKRSRNYEMVVWSNLQALGIRPDLKKLDQVRPLPIDFIQLPRFTLISQNNFVEVLFKLLNSQGSLQEGAWRLLERLPIDFRTINKIVSLQKIDLKQMSAKQQDYYLLVLNGFEQILCSEAYRRAASISKDYKDWLMQYLPLGLDQLLLKARDQTCKDRSLVLQIYVRCLIIKLRGQNKQLDLFCKIISHQHLYITSEQQEQLQQLQQPALLNSDYQEVKDMLLCQIKARIQRKDSLNIILTGLTLLQQYKILQDQTVSIEATLKLLFDGLYTSSSQEFFKPILTIYAFNRSLRPCQAKLVFDMIKSSFYLKDVSSSLYDLFSAVFEVGLMDSSEQQFALNIVQLIVKKLQNDEIKQPDFKSDKQQSVLGLLRLLRSMLTPHSCQPFLNYIDRFFSRDVFGFEDESQIKFKSKASRQLCYQILIKLLRCQESSKKVVQIISKQDLNKLFNRFASFKLSSYYNYEPRSQLGYAGIRNLGCICYMLAMIQQLFHQNSFRNIILMAEDNQAPNLNKSKTGKPFDDNVFHQFQILFSGLLKSMQSQVNPQDFCLSFKDMDGKPVDVLTQQDSQQFMNMLFDRLQTSLKGTPFKDIINSIFGGKTCNQLRCISCGKVKSRQQNFLNLSLDIKNIKNLEQSLTKYIQEERISDYECEFCNKKTDIAKRTLLAQLPNSLIIHLQRICYNYDHFENQKINSRLFFPKDLDLQNFTEANFNDPPQKVDAQYRLKGVVVHIGSAQSGHYYSYIKVDQQRWLQFNDQRVREFDPKKIESQCFGGASEQSSYYWAKRQSCKSAYLLVYEKVNKTPITLTFNSPEEKQQMLGKHELSSYVIDQQVKQDKINVRLDIEKRQAKSLPRLLERVNSDNHNFRMINFLTSSDFHNLVFHLVSTHPEGKNFDTLIMYSEALFAFKKDAVIHLGDVEMSQLNRLIRQLQKQQGNQDLLQKLNSFKTTRKISLITWLHARFNKLIKGLGKQFFEAKVSNWIGQIINAEKSVRKYIRWMTSSSILDMIQVKELQIRPNSQDKDLAENAGHYRLLVYLKVLLNLITGQNKKHFSSLTQFFGLWTDLVQKSDWVIRWLCQHEFVNKILYLTLKQSSKESMSYSYWYIDYSTVYDLICTILAKSNLNLNCLNPAYTLSKQEIRLLQSSQLIENSFKHSERMLDLLMELMSGQSQHFSQRVGNFLLNQIGKITHSDNMKVAMKNLIKYFKYEQSLARKKCEWVLGWPRLKNTKKSSQSGYGLYTISNNQDELIVFQSTLGNKPLLDYLQKNYLKLEHYSVVIIGELLTLANQNQAVFSYLAQLPASQYSYGRYVDWFPNYVEKYYEMCKKPHFTSGYYNNALNALNHWSIFQRSYKLHLQSQRVQRLLAVEGNSLKECTFLGGQCQLFTRPLILGRSQNSIEIKRITPADGVQIKQTEVDVWWMDSQPDINGNIAIPNWTTLNYKRRMEYIYVPSAAAHDSKYSQFINKNICQEQETSPDLSENFSFGKAECQGLVRTLTISNSSSKKYEISFCYKLREKTDIMIPQSRITVCIGSSAHQAALTIQRQPGQPWPQYEIEVEKILSEEQGLQECSSEDEEFSLQVWDYNGESMKI